MKKLKVCGVYIIIGIILTIMTFNLIDSSIKVDINYKSNNEGSMQLFYNNIQSKDSIFSEDYSIINKIDATDNKFKTLSYKLDLDKIRKMRIDIDGINEIKIQSIDISSIGVHLYKYTPNKIIDNFIINNDVDIINNTNDVDIIAVGQDPYIANIDIVNIGFKVKIISCLIGVFFTLILIKFGNEIIIKHINMSNEKLLIILFLCIITIPNIMLYIPLNDSTQNIENRVLNEKPQLYINKFGEFTKQYENYYNDNLPLKKYFIKLNSYIKYNILDISPQKYVIKGKDGWLFYNSKYKNDGDTLADYKGSNYYTLEQLNNFKKKLETIKEICEQNGSEFYLMIGPNKSQIYSQYIPEKYGLKCNKSKTDILVEYLSKNTDINIVYPKNKLLELKNKYQLYYKLDTHWNDLGAYVGYSELKESIEKVQVPKLDEVDILEQDITSGDLANMIGLNNELKDKYFSIKDIQKYKVNLINSSESQQLRYNSSNKNGKKLVCFRDSFFTSVIPYLSQDFENSLFLWQKNFDKEVIEKEKPDIVIMESVERLIDQIN